MKNKFSFFILISILCSFSLSNKNSLFSINSKANNNIAIDFALDNYEVKKISGLDDVYFKNKKSSYLEDQEKFSTFVHLKNNQEYSIDFQIVSDESYDFEGGDRFYDSSSNLNYSTKEHIFRGVRILEVSVHPFKINQNSNSINIINQASINISLEDLSNDSMIRYSETFLNMINDFLINPIEYSSRDLDFQQPSILYISDPDVVTSPYLLGLVNWRKQQGYDVTLVSTDETGNSTSSIKNYIENAYYSWDNPPEYLCLVGDADGSVSVPTYDVSAGAGSGGAHGESDYPYTLIEGDDYYPEMIVGRISVRSSSELATVVNKIIGYEKAYAGTGDWLTSAALVGDPYDSGISCVITSQYIEQIMENSGVENIESQYSGSNFDSFMREQINSGISYLNYRGFYGFSNFNQNDVDQLNNGYKLPFISTLTCGVNSFLDDQESVVEALLRAGSAANPSGAVGVIGTSQSYTHTAFNNIVSMGIFEGIYLKESGQTAGSSLVYGKLALMNTYPSDPNGNVYLFSSWNNLMGDPLTHLWTNTPKNLIVNHDSIISSSSNYFDVMVSDPQGRPVNDAIVTLYKNDEHSITSKTDEFGRAYFNLDYVDIGNVIVTSRCLNCVPEESSFEITNDFPNVGVVQNSINISDTADGNSDGQANPGETVTISFDIQNQSSDQLSDCSVQVSSVYPNIQIVNGLETIGSINSSDVIEVGNISLSLNNNINHDGNSFSLHSSLECDGMVWNFLLPIDIAYGDVVISLELISDQNNNLILDPGETGQYSLNIDNTGYIDLYDLSLTFEDYPNIQIENNSIQIDVLNEGAQNNSIIIPIVASNNIINGSIINLSATLQSTNGYISSDIETIQVGYVSSTDPLGPDQHGYYIYGEEDNDYMWAPIYDWIEIDPDYGGEGIEVDIFDGGNNQDDSTILSLPFTFTFYGQDYDEITICSNGWISLGRTEMASFRNYNLPGTGGPSPMIAVFWDDLQTTNGGDVFWYYDSINDYLVIEWSEVRTYTDNDVETFQAILYNSGDLTPTGDDEIKLQYKEFNNTSEGYYPVGNYDGAVVHGQYSTIGIENWYGDIGLEYTFNNGYPVSATPLTDESALFITTRNPQIFAQPSLNLSDNSFNIELSPDESDDLSLIITNDGQEGSILNYEISLSPFNNLVSSVDELGYAWSSSSLSNDVEYSWEDISPNANLLTFEANDQATGPIGIGFSFPFYGQSYTEIIVNPNGWVGFSEDNDGWNNQSVFSDDSPHNAIFAFWDDLNPESSQDNDVGSGNVYLDSNSDRCIIWYDSVSHWTSLDRIYDFQLILYPDGSIKVNYREMTGDVDSGTIGIVNQDGTIGHQIVYNDEFMEDNLSVSFKGAPTWLNYYYSGGDSEEETSLGYNQSSSYSIEVDSFNLPQGQYSASLIVNPEGSFFQTLPINLTVLDYEFIAGDINFDGALNILDIVSLMGFIIQSADPSEIEFLASDINQDNNLDVLDVVIIVNIILSE